MKLIWRLLRKNISIGQIAGYALANLVGLSIILCGIHFYRDVASALGLDGSDQSVVDSEYIILSREVTLANTIGMKRADGFSPDDIREIEEQPWAKSVGAFTAANFNVSASVSFQGNGMASYMFLEAVPDAYVDNKPLQWHYRPGEEVPIIISKDYLALYNFGFATSQGLPQITEGVISQVPITLYLSGNGRYERVTARIMGFSTRLNTIAVPQEFMDWANQRFSAKPQPEPSRLIVEVSKPGDPQIMQFVKDHDYEIGGDKANSGKMSFFLSLLTTIVVAIGAIICALSLFILMLSLTLLLQKNRDKNQGLLLLGYSPMQVAASYFRLVVITNLLVLICAIAIMIACSALWQAPLSQIGLQPTSLWPPILWGVAIMAVITVINFLSIKRNIDK